MIDQVFEQLPGPVALYRGLPDPIEVGEGGRIDGGLWRRIRGGTQTAVHDGQGRHRRAQDAFHAADFDPPRLLATTAPRASRACCSLSRCAWSISWRGTHYPLAMLKSNRV